MIDLEDESKERKRNIKQVDHFCDFFLDKFFQQTYTAKHFKKVFWT